MRRDKGQRTGPPKCRSVALDTSVARCARNARAHAPTGNSVPLANRGAASAPRVATRRGSLTRYHPPTAAAQQWTCFTPPGAWRPALTLPAAAGSWSRRRPTASNL